jgi:two-component system sensor histidine kinase PilS (NtrC family)
VLVRIDPGHLHQVAWNLCENAIKSAGKTTCGIAVEMHVGRRANNRRPYLKIVDHGLGVPKHLQENLFEPFAAGPDGGTGLGLFICRELCEQNKATLHYLPGDNGGSIFQVVFADPSRWDV